MVERDDKDETLSSFICFMFYTYYVLGLMFIYASFFYKNENKFEKNDYILTNQTNMNNNIIMYTTMYSTVLGLVGALVKEFGII